MKRSARGARRKTRVAGAFNALALVLLWASSATAQGEVTPPVVKTRVDAVYPPSALPPGGHADVVLLVTVDAKGVASRIDVEQSGGTLLDRAASRAVQAWTFDPAQRSGEPVASRIRIPFHFASAAAAAQSTDAPPPKPGSGGGYELGTAGTPHGANGDGGLEIVRVHAQAPESYAASDFRIQAPVLSLAPHRTAADLLSSAPGFFVTHPEGEAVAQRVYLRGFDAEHGQDIEFSVSGIPLNQPSHLHGQGYADLHLILPEVVRELRVTEGVYDPHQGDFAVAGSVDYRLGVEERGTLAKASYGSFATRRLVAVFAPEGQSTDTFGAVSFRDTDGFGDGTRGASAGTAMGQYRLALPAGWSARFHFGAHAARANIAGVVRRDDLQGGAVGFYDAYPDPSARSQSASSGRAQVGVQVVRETEAGGLDEVRLWVSSTSYRSRTNFTGYTQRSQIDPTWVGRGDLIEQSNLDSAFGGRLEHRTPRTELFEGLTSQFTVGLDGRRHAIEQAQNLLRAPQNETWDQRVDADVGLTGVAGYADVHLASRYFRGHVGARADYLAFDVDDRLGNFIPAVSKKSYIVGFRRTAAGLVAGPRASAEFRPTTGLKVQAAYGEGYRSPQARQLEEGEQAPFAKVRSFDLGATLATKSAVSFTMSGFATKLSSDSAFDPTEGRLERIGPTTRVGVASYLVARPASWFTAALSGTLVRATLDEPPSATPENPTPPYSEGQSLPYVPPLVVRSDVGVQGEIAKLGGKPVTGSLGYGTTFLAPRPLPYGLSSPAVFLLDARASLRRDIFELILDGTNLLDRKYAETEYAFVSNWRPGAIPSRIPARHVTAGPPLAVMLSLAVHL